MGANTSCPLCFSMSPVTVGQSHPGDEAGRSESGRKRVVHYTCIRRGEVAEWLKAAVC